MTVRGLKNRGAVGRHVGAWVAVFPMLAALGSGGCGGAADAMPASGVSGGAAPDIGAPAGSAGASGAHGGTAGTGGRGGAGAGPETCGPRAYNEICEANGWCWMHPFPPATNATAVWVPSPEEIWISTAALSGDVRESSIVKRSLDAWTKTRVNAGMLISSFWGAGRTPLWGTGRGDDITQGVIARWDGTRWSEDLRVSDLFLGFTDIDGTAPDDVWAAGLGKVAHFDGTSWTVIDLGLMPPNTGGNARISAAARDDVWAAMGRNLLHWNGASWARETVDLVITDIWAAGPNAAYRALQAAQLGGPPEIQRWDGTSWTPVPLVLDPAANIVRIDASGPGDVWALNAAGIAYHFDGVSWARQDAGGYFAAVDLFARTPGFALAVGAAGEIRQFVSGAWRSLSESVPADIQAMSGAARDDIWFAGSVGMTERLTRPEPALLHWDGGWVSSVRLPDDATALSSVWAIASAPPGAAGSSRTVVWVGGANGFLARREGGAWQTFSVTAATVSDIWGATVDDAWMADSLGAVFHWDGQTWSRATVPLSLVFDIHGTAPDDVWMSGVVDVAHWDGATWTHVQIDESLTGEERAVGGRIWATARNDVWVNAAVQRGTLDSHTEIHHFDGNRFQLVPFPDELGFFVGIEDLWSPGPGELYAGRPMHELGGILRFKNGSWEDIGMPLPHVWGVPGGYLWAAGDDGVIMRRLLSGGGACVHHP